MRIESKEHELTGSSGSSKGDGIELRKNDKAQEVAAGRLQFPEALAEEDRSSGDEADGDGTFQFYKVYKRRWFGLVQLTLLNIIVSWDVSIQYLLFDYATFLVRLCKYAFAMIPAYPSNFGHGCTCRRWLRQWVVGHALAKLYS